MKRALDILAALAGLVILSPLLLATAIAVRALLGRPILFRQLRPGLHGRPFELVKFRTMLDDPRLGTGVASDAQRLTRFGRLLRASSLDELPQLWNVLRGEMSLVGPRPLLMSYMERYSPEQARRHEVKPGLTGWAQVNGRNAVSWDERFALDLWYVDHRSFLLDLRILAMTGLRLVRPRGISAAGQATMPEFTGSAPSAGEPVSHETPSRYSVGSQETQN
jgi:lipopolysaccharide/colanic/teichoic acid biosynthesis glycosyltransferase